MVLDLFPRLRERLQVVRTMSGGEQQMVAVGRALMTSPEIVLLDEPSLGLAPIMCTELFDALARIRSTGVGILLVEQNARLKLKVADRSYISQGASSDPAARHRSRTTLRFSAPTWAQAKFISADRFPRARRSHSIARGRGELLAQ